MPRPAGNNRFCCILEWRISCILLVERRTRRKGRVRARSHVAHLIVVQSGSTRALPPRLGRSLQELRD
jgi:hypothetical protein